MRKESGRTTVWSGRQVADAVRGLVLLALLPGLVLLLGCEQPPASTAVAQTGAATATVATAGPVGTPEPAGTATLAPAERQPAVTPGQAAPASRMGTPETPGQSARDDALPTATPTASAVAGSAGSPVASGSGLSPVQATPTQRPPATPQPTVGAAPGGVTAAGGRLFLEVSEPAAELLGVPEGARSVVVAGRTQPAAVVSLDGRLVDVDRAGGFRGEVALEDDITVIEIVASDVSGAETRAQRIVVRE